MASQHRSDGLWNMNDQASGLELLQESISIMTTMAHGLGLELTVTIERLPVAHEIDVELAFELDMATQHQLEAYYDQPFQVAV